MDDLEADDAESVSSAEPEEWEDADCIEVVPDSEGSDLEYAVVLTDGRRVMAGRDDAVRLLQSGCVGELRLAGSG